MNTPGRPGRPLLILLVLLIISILLDRYLIAGLFPWISVLGGLSPMIVFLDIPLRLPVIDPIPVGILFSIFYSILLAAHPSRYGTMAGRDLRRRLGNLFAGATILLIWMAAGGLLYYFARDYLSREIRNGIDSFGIQMDIYNPYPGHEILRLRGSMILLICCIIGSRILLKRAGVAMQPVPVRLPVTERERVRVIVSAIPEPEELPEPVKPRAVATRVPVVAPLRVEPFVEPFA